jgi:hypothetical protein
VSACSDLIVHDQASTAGSILRIIDPRFNLHEYNAYSTANIMHILQDSFNAACSFNDHSSEASLRRSDGERAVANLLALSLCTAMIAFMYMHNIG